MSIPLDQTLHSTSDQAFQWVLEALDELYCSRYVKMMGLGLKSLKFASLGSAPHPAVCTYSTLINTPPKWPPEA